MISMGVGPLSSVFLKIQAMSKATTIPSRYIESMVRPGSFRNPSTVKLGMQAAMRTV